jgi:cell division protein FtsQ
MPDDIRQQLVSVDASSAQDVTFVLSNGAEVVWGEADETQRKAVVLRALLASIGAPTQIDVTVPDAPVFK